MSVPQPANRLFLLTLVAPLACGSEAGRPGTGVASATAAPEMDTSGRPEDAADDDGDSAGGSSPDGDDEGDTAADSDTADADTADADTADSDIGTTGELPYCGEPPAALGELSQLCVDYEARVADCFHDGAVPRECEGYYEVYCQNVLELYEMEDGPACRAALEDELACINALTCREFESDARDPCADETAGVEAACPSAR